jgi:hypothetical protein
MGLKQKTNLDGKPKENRELGRTILPSAGKWFLNTRFVKGLLFKRN